MTLFVNGCVRERSRTLKLAKAVLESLPGSLEEICLYPDGPAGLDGEKLRMREELAGSGDYSHPMFRFARQFAEADTVVVAAPYWDMAFPAKVRAYFEEVTVSGITFRYTPAGVPEGLCRAKKLIYVTTAGGPIFQNFGFEYIKALATVFYGIADVRLVKAEGLDIWGADTDGILERAKSEIPEILGL